MSSKAKLSKQAHKDPISPAASRFTSRYSAFAQKYAFEDSFEGTILEADTGSMTRGMTTEPSSVSDTYLGVSNPKRTCSTMCIILSFF
mmetsp:Transcript_68/g.171  ORF Transcript_68/g.171 Transcript_68/m.171 type:complete len:88 (-) Transcript_68:1435-1698(-)